MGEKSDEIEIQRIILKNFQQILESLMFLNQALEDIKGNRPLSINSLGADKSNHEIAKNNVRLHEIFEQLDRDKYK